MGSFAGYSRQASNSLGSGVGWTPSQQRILPPSRLNPKVTPLNLEETAGSPLPEPNAYLRSTSAAVSSPGIPGCVTGQHLSPRPARTRSQLRQCSTSLSSAPQAVPTVLQPAAVMSSEALQPSGALVGALAPPASAPAASFAPKIAPAAAPPAAPQPNARVAGASATRVAAAAAAAAATSAARGKSSQSGRPARS